MTTTAACPVDGPDAAVEPDRLPWADVLAWRDRRYHRRSDLKLHTEDQAREFVDAVGFCFLFPAPGVELPSLWEAINGRSREVPKRHFDHALGLTWNWKDSLPARRVVWYGKLLRGKPMLVSLRLLPAFYALSENYGDLEDYRQQFADGRMSVTARDVYEVLLAQGPLSTNALRKQAGLFGGGEVARRFERAIVELQQDLKIVKCGTAEDNRWKYCYVYDLLLRWRPELAEEARTISSREARRQVLLRYLDAVGAAPQAALQTLFGWEPGILQRTVDDLRAAGRLRAVEIPDLPAALRKPSRKLRAPDPGAAVWLALSRDHGLA